MSDIIRKAVEEISKRHREIIDDWCKAYLSQLYEEGVDIKPGCFTLNEQHMDNVSGSVLGKRYWFEKGTPNYSGWISVKDRLPEKHKEVLTFRKDYYGNDEIIISYLSWMCGEDPIWADEVSNYTHWMPLPSPPEDRGILDQSSLQ